MTDEPGRATTLPAARAVVRGGHRAGAPDCQQRDVVIGDETMRHTDRRHRPDGTFDVVIPETEHEAIYRAWRQGESQHAIAARYGVWHTTIAWICNRFVTRHPERACDIAILEAPRQYAGRVQIAANNMVTERDWALSIQWRHEPWLPGYPAYEQYQRVAAAWRAGELDITEPLAAD